MIPCKLQPYRFIKLGKWNEYKNKKKEIKVFQPKDKEELQKIIKEGWIPQAKAPQEFRWQLDRNYTYSEINAWLLTHKENYGVLNEVLRVLDDDTSDKKLIKLFLDNFGKTFRVRDHLYFEFTNKDKKKIVFYDKEGKHCGELQGEGSQVVGANSIHPSGEVYELKEDIDIIKVDYDKFKEVFINYLPLKIKEVQKDYEKTTWTGDNVTSIPITNIISLAGLNDMGNSCYQGPHPGHGSNGGMNFRVNTSQNSWYCFRCGAGGGPSELIGVMEGIINCSQAGSNCFTAEQGKKVIEIAREKYGLTKPEIQETNEPMGWAISIDIRRLADRKGWNKCPKCKSNFGFNTKIGFFKCECSKGTIKQFVELMSKQKDVEVVNDGNN